MARYRKKPVEIDAVTWTGTNLAEVQQFLGEDFAGLKWSPQHNADLLLIRTLENPENPFEAPPEWKILQGVQGEHYACEPGIFAATYEAVTD